MYLAPLIDSTLLDPLRSPLDLDELCDDAARRRFAAVVVLPRWVPYVAARLRATPSGEARVAVSTVISFPHGGDLTEAKAAAAEACAAAGADELEMVMDTAALRSDDFARATADLTLVTSVVRGLAERSERRVLVKAVVETGALTESQVRGAAKIATDAGVNQVVAATGAGPRPASPHDVESLLALLPISIEVKAGGVTTRAEADALAEAGAARIGTSAAVGLVT